MMSIAVGLRPAEGCVAALVHGERASRGEEQAARRHDREEFGARSTARCVSATRADERATWAVRSLAATVALAPT